MMPKKRYLETGEAVKPDANMLVGKWAVNEGGFNTRRKPVSEDLDVLQIRW